MGDGLWNFVRGGRTRPSRMVSLGAHRRSLVFLSRCVLSYRPAASNGGAKMSALFHDAQSRPVKVSYNGVLYTYAHNNLQGDIVGLLDSNGSLVVEYKYDAWGKPLSTTGTLAGTLGKRNPFRYRGYVYDAETGLYYLRSRYYHWAWSRFINADIAIMYNRRLLDQNLFTYCGNSTPTRKDPSGKSFFDRLFERLEISITMYLMSFSQYPDNKINVSGTSLGDTINERIRQTNQYRTKISRLASAARSAENKTITQTVDFYFDPFVAEEIDLGLSFRRISMDVTCLLYTSPSPRD